MKTPALLTRVGLLAVTLSLISAPVLHAEDDAKPEKPLSAAKKEFDKDGDGKLNEEEAAAYAAARKAARQAQLEKYDTDKDGKLSDEEKAAMKADQKKQKEKKSEHE